MKSVGEGGVRVNPESLRLDEMRITEGREIWEEKCIRERLQKMPGDFWKNKIVFYENIQSWSYKQMWKLSAKM